MDHHQLDYVSMLFSQDTLQTLSFLAIGDASMDPIDFPIAPVDAMAKV